MTSFYLSMLITVPTYSSRFEVMEMCWQEADDRPTADDMMAFLQQIDEESTNSPAHSVHRQRSIDSDKFVPNGPSTPTHGFSTTILSPKVGKHSTQHVAEVLVHRVDDTDFIARNEGASGFEDDFSKINIRKNTKSDGFEDDFVHCDNDKVGSDDEISQNDTSILAFGGNASEMSETESLDKVKHISTDPNMNVLTEPVPITMSTPSKTNGSDQLNLPNTKPRKTDLFKTALDNQVNQSSSEQYLTATDMNTNNSCATKSWTEAETNGKHSNENQNDEGYRTDPSRTPDIIVSTNLTDLHEHEDNNETSLDMNRLSVNDSSRTTDPETEKAKEIYISKGATLPPSSLHKSRSLGTIPEDGIPSDDTSQTGVVFDEPGSAASEDIGQGFEGFEWDDYIGEELVGRVRYTSDESPRPTEEFTEWTFDPESGSETSTSKPGSIASESDGEVTRSTPTSIDTRAYIANLLSNRLNTLAQQTKTNHYSNSSSFYSFSQYDDSFEHAYSDTESPPFSPMSPIAENPNAMEILKHEIDLENLSAARILNNQSYEHNDLQPETSISMPLNTRNLENSEAQNTNIAHDLEPKSEMKVGEHTADDNQPSTDVKSVDSLQLEEYFVWVDNQKRQGQVTILI